MSRREDSGSDSKRHRSRFDREPSPKRSRRDGLQETERPHIDNKLDSDPLDRDQKQRRRLHDALPLEAPLGHDPKLETGTVIKEVEHKTNGNREGTKHSSDQEKVPRSETYFQHDDRDRQDRRSFGRRTDSERGWRRDPKEPQNDKVENKKLAKDEKVIYNTRKDDRAWRHDGYFEMEANPKPPARNRPSFSEQKIAINHEKTEKLPTVNPVTPHPRGNDEREHKWRHKAEGQRGNFTSRDRYRGRDQLTGRQEHYRPNGGTRVEKWKHDLYNDANKSPKQKNDEDKISKIEALLNS